jgi:hypothetical protein
MENDSDGARGIIIPGNSSPLFLLPASIRAYGEAVRVKENLELAKNRYKI